MTSSKRDEKSSLNQPAQWSHHPLLHRPVATSMTCAITSFSIPGNCPLLSSPSRFIENGVNKRTWYISITNHAMTEEKFKLYRSHTVPFFSNHAPKLARHETMGRGRWGDEMKFKMAATFRIPHLFRLFLKRPGSVGPWASACTVVPQCRLCDIEIVYSFLYSVSYLEFCFCAGLLNAFPEWLQPSGFSLASLFKGMEWTKVRDSSLIFLPYWVISLK